MLSQKVIIKNPTGLHLRPAGIFCDAANQYESKVSIMHKGSIANAKSVLGVLGACVKSGDEIEIICDGPDEAKALEGMLAAVADGLGE